MPTDWENANGIVVTKEQVKKQLGNAPPPQELGGSQQPSSEDLKISSSNWEDWFRNYVSAIPRGFARQGGEVLGGGAGALLGKSPITSTLGASAGGILADQTWQQTLGRIWPRGFGGPSSNPIESLKTSAMETGADLALVKGVPALKGALKNKLISRFPSDPNIPIKNALKSLPSDFEPTIGQATQNKFAKWIENVVLPRHIKDLRIKEQQTVLGRLRDDISREITGSNFKDIPTKQELGATLSTSTKSLYKVVHEERRVLYDTAKSEIADSTVTGFRVAPPKSSTLINPVTGQKFPPGPSQLIPTQISGPVYPTRTIDFARNTVLKDIDEVLADPNTGNYQLPEVKATMDALKNKVLTFAKGNLVNGEGQPVMNYVTAQADKEELNTLFLQTPKVARARLAETIKTMRNLLGQDISESSASWTPQAKAAFEKAKAYHIQTFKKLYGPTIAKKLARIGKFTDNPDIIEENILQMGLDNSTIAQEIVDSSGTRVPLAGEYIKKFFNSMTGANEEMMGTNGIDYLKSTKEVAAKFLSADQRAALDNFSRSAQLATLESGQTPMTSIAFRGGYMLLSGLTGLAAGNLTGSAATGIAAMALIPWARGSLTKMMMNPANARMAAKLTRLPIGSSEAVSLTKQLFKTGLRGVRFELQSATGEGLGFFEPQSDGKLRKVTDETVDKPTKLDTGVSVIGWE